MSYCYRGGSHTASSAPPEGTIAWILAISIRTPFPIIPHTWDWLITHTCTSFTHTHINHTHTWTLCEVLICLAVISERYTRVCFLVLWPWIVYPLFWLFAAYPDLDCLLDCDCLPPALISCPVFDSVSALSLLICLPVSDPVLPDHSQ